MGFFLCWEQIGSNIREIWEGAEPVSNTLFFFSLTLLLLREERVCDASHSRRSDSVVARTECNLNYQIWRLLWEGVRKLRAISAVMKIIFNILN